MTKKEFFISLALFPISLPSADSRTTTLSLEIIADSLLVQSLHPTNFTFWIILHSILVFTALTHNVLHYNCLLVSFPASMWALFQSIFNFAARVIFLKCKYENKTFLKNLPMIFPRLQRKLTTLDLPYKNHQGQCLTISGLGTSHVLKCFLHSHHTDISLVPAKSHFLLPPCYTAQGFLCLVVLYIFLQLSSFV